MNKRRAVGTGVATTLLAGLGLVGVARASATQTIPDYAGHLTTSQADCDGVTTTPYNATADAYSLYNQVRDMGADMYYQHNIFGDGIGIAMIDSGVSPVQGFDSTNVKDGPDLSFESQAPYATGTDPSNNEPYEPNSDLPHNDTFGHGTHMAGIMVGHDDNSGSTADGHAPFSWNDPTKFTGVAPGAHIISLKVADSSGAVDVTQVIAAVDWVVQHRNDAGMNIRVLNLSYGFRATDIAENDPLAYALQQAWNAGIVVVVAAGNAGHTTIAGTKLLMPAQDSHVLIVGAYDLNNSDRNPDDDLSADFSSSSALHGPDIIAPGAHVQSLHSVGSHADDEIKSDCLSAWHKHEAWHSPYFGDDERFVRGSGTSQATAMVSGAVALMLSKPGNENLKPDAVKAILRNTAYSGKHTPAGSIGNDAYIGKGEIRLASAYYGTGGTPPPYSLPINGGGPVGAERGPESLPCLDRNSTISLRGTLTWKLITTRTGAVIHVPWYVNDICSDTYNKYRDASGRDRVAMFNIDVRGMPFDSEAHATQEKILTSGPNAGQYAHPHNTPWTTVDGVEYWNGAPWLGLGWTTDPTLGREVWNQISWDGLDWLGGHWTGGHWTGGHWTGGHWTGGHWTTGSWLGGHWTDSYWADNSWS